VRAAAGRDKLCWAFEQHPGSRVTGDADDFCCARNGRASDRLAGELPTVSVFPIGSSPGHNMRAIDFADDDHGGALLDLACGEVAPAHDGNSKRVEILGCDEVVADRQPLGFRNDRPIGRKAIAFRMVKVVVLTPMPKASAIAAVAVKAGCRRSSLNAYRTSCRARRTGPFYL
jgi:hypothetical protein